MKVWSTGCGGVGALNPLRAGLQAKSTASKLMRNAESTAASLEAEVASRLSASESRTLIRLLQKVYL